MESLIQRRFALERGRNGGIGTVVFGSIFLALGVGKFSTGDFSAFDWVQIAIAAFALIYGVILIRRYRSARAAFEREYGVDAGRQIRTRPTDQSRPSDAPSSHTK